MIQDLILNTYSEGEKYFIDGERGMEMTISQMQAVSVFKCIQVGKHPGSIPVVSFYST